MPHSLDWTHTDTTGRRVSCTVHQNPEGGYTVRVAIDGESLLGRHCADIDVARFVVAAFRQDTLRDTPTDAKGGRR